MDEAWSPAARSVWGKTDRGLDYDLSLPLVQHLEDAAAVAGHLWDTWIPGRVRDRLAQEIGSDDDARTLFTFLAGIHDVGKATPAFALLAGDVQMPHLLAAMERAGLTCPALPRDQRPRHTLTGHIALEEWLKAAHAFEPGRATALGSIVSAHHGVPATQPQLDSLRGFARPMGDGPWREVRDEILSTMARQTCAEPVLKRLRTSKLSLLAQIDLSALVIVADWIASDSDRFPYAEPIQPTASRLAAAIQTLDLRPPWNPRTGMGPESLFAVSFPHLADLGPSELQLVAARAAAEVSAPALMLIEAPTGSGKSEAALLAAEVLARRFGMGGVYIGLPTMATSNAMFGRVLRWVEAWPDNHDPALWLAHGKAALNEDFAGLVRESRVRSVHDEEGKPGRATARVSSWLSGRKKGILANVVVGTIDQVLMGALQARHLALRHLGLSSKVVIVDEVHSADSYMRSYLVRMLEYLGAYGTPVILLSATLPPAQRAELVTAYQRGRAQRLAPSSGAVRRRRWDEPGTSTEDNTPTASGPGPEAYPLITVATDTVEHRQITSPQVVRHVVLEQVDDDPERLADRLEHELAGGGCVAVIRNTVRRAQETYAVLADRFGGDVELFHSRFLAADRAVRERRLVQRLGPPGSDRPERLIVVGTQVLEQSLDIDLDLLVTDIAPVDLVVQRIGRLHRHDRSAARPTGFTKPQCLVTGVSDWMAPVPQAESGTRAVYGQALVLRSLAVLEPFLDGQPLVLPADGPKLVHRAYDPDLPPPPGWESDWEHAEKRWWSGEDKSKSKALAFQAPSASTLASLVGWGDTPVPDRRDDVGHSQVRDSEDGIEVIVVRRDEAGRLRLLPGDFPGAGDEIPIRPLDHEVITRQIAASTVGLPRSLTHPGTWERTVTQLERDPVADEWQDSRWLAGQLVLVLDQDLSATLTDRLVTYDPDRGLEVSDPNAEGQV